MRVLDYYRHLYLLLSLSIFLLIYPYFEGEGPQRAVIIFLVALILLTAINVASTSRRQFWVGIGLGVPWAALTVLSIFGTIPAFRAITLLVGTSFFFFATIIVIRHVLTDEEITTDTLYAAISGYLLLGFAWSGLYIIILQLYPESFSNVSIASSDYVSRWSDIVYFSYVTLTTLGYGDITPVSSQAKSLAFLEAVCGVFYTAIIVARLVGGYIRHRQKVASDESDKKS